MSISAVKCPVPALPLNGKIIAESMLFEYQDIVRFECDKGYKLIGSDSMKCLYTGKWFGHEPECEGIFSKVSLAASETFSLFI